MQLDDRITIATPEGVAIEVVLAGLGSRFLARLLDTVIQVLAIIALGFGMAAANGSGKVLAVGIVLIFFVVFAYDVAFEVLNHGRTIGKVAAGIRVVGDGGDPVRFLASAIRNIVRIVDFLPIFYLVGSISIVATAARPAARRPRRGNGGRPRPLPRSRPTTRADHRDARRGRDVGRVGDQARGGARGAAVPRPPARAALRRRVRISPSTSPTVSDHASSACRPIPTRSTCSKASSSPSSTAHRHAAPTSGPRSPVRLCSTDRASGSPA